MWTLIQSIKQTLSSYPFSQTWTFFFFTSSSAKLIPTLHEQPILPKKRNKINVSLLVTIFKDTSTVLKVRRCGYSPCSVVWNAVSWSPKTAGGSLRKDRSGRSGTDRQTDRQLVSLRSFDLKMRLKKSCAVLDIWAGLPGWGTFVWSLPLSLPLWQETEQQQRRKSCWLNLLCGVISAQFNQQQLIQPNYSPSWRARWSFFYALCNFRL